MHGKDGLAPLTGVAFCALLVAFFAIAPFPPLVAEASIDELVGFYLDHGDRVLVGSLLQSLAAAMFLLFAAVLHQAMRASGAGASAVGLMVGATLFAAGATLDATLNAAGATSAGDVDPVATQALTALYEFAYLPAATGMFVFLLSWGVGAIRHGGFPTWAGWVLVVVAVPAIFAAVFFPAFHFVLLSLAVAVLAASIKLSIDARQPAAADTVAVRQGSSHGG